MKAILLLLTLSFSVFALSINDSLLKVHATLVPKIYLMDYKFKDKIHNNTISIAILYQQKEYRSAKKLKKLIESKYKDGLNSYKVEAKLVNYSNTNLAEANVYYLFPAKKSNIKKAIRRASIDNSLTFAYQKEDLQYGVMISVDISKRIKPLLNLEAISMNNITLRPVLIKISTIYIMDLDSRLKNLDIRGFYLFLPMYLAQVTIV
ncbi:MAG: YfiR/HmsC family protein [Sulfurimonas sp.]|nr:YfiR/HmsC family protein [Sulfurimonas sp.]